jgi:hypothetical protein
MVMAVSLAEAGPSSSNDTLCPDPSEVEAQLVRLGVRGGTRPEITVTDGKMCVVLRGQDGSTLGSREVEAPTSCHERATVAAVLVATWMGVWPQADPVADPPPVPVAEGPPKPRIATGPAPVKPARAVDLGLALVSAYDGNAFASGLAIESRWRLLGSLRGFVGLSATTEREKSIGPGRARYTRPALEAGPSLGLESGRLRLEIGLSGRFGILVVRGKDLPVTHVSTRAVPGMAAWLRLVFAGRTLSPFFTVGGATWFGRQSATLDDAPARVDLPRWDAQLGMGILWAPGGS